MSGFKDLFGAEPDTPTELKQLQETLVPECPVPTGNPRIIQPNNTPGIGPVPGMGTLTEELGAVVDDIRQLYTDFGQRPYRVFSVRYRWTGGKDGRGRQELVERIEFLPTPHVNGLTLGTELKAAGEDETGYVTIKEISPRYTEDQIRVMAPQAGQLPPGEFAFIEVQADNRDGPNTKARRLTVSDVPWRDAETFEWQVRAYIQEEARERDGSFSERTLYPAGPQTDGV